MLTAALSALLVILVGATVFVLLTRPTDGPAPSPSRTPGATLLPPSPTTVALASAPSSLVASLVPASTNTAPPTLPSLPSAAASVAPSPTATSTRPSPTPSPVPTASPTPTPSLIPSIPAIDTPVPTIAPSPTATPTITPTSPQHEFHVDAVGLDDKSLDGSVPRIVTFEIDGPSNLSASVSGATGSVQLCVWREAVDDERVCRTGRSVMITHPVTDLDSTLWHVSMIGARGVAPSAALTVVFNANAPSVSLDDFRFYGSSNPPYNGFAAEFDAAAGPISAQGAFDDGQDGAYDYHLVVQAAGSDALVDTTDNGTSFAVQKDASAGHYVVSIVDPDPLANPGLAVFVTATITWS